MVECMQSYFDSLREHHGATKVCLILDDTINEAPIFCTEKEDKEDKEDTTGLPPSCPLRKPSFDDRLKLIGGGDTTKSSSLSLPACPRRLLSFDKNGPMTCPLRKPSFDRVGGKKKSSFERKTSTSSLRNPSFNRLNTLTVKMKRTSLMNDLFEEVKPTRRASLDNSSISRISGSSRSSSNNTTTAFMSPKSSRWSAKPKKSVRYSRRSSCC